MGMGNGMALTVDSPRFSLRTDLFDGLHSALREIGHVVLDAVWSQRFLVELHRLAKQKFETDDARYADTLDQQPEDVRQCYLGGVTDIYSLFDDRAQGAAKDSEFFSEVTRSGLPVLFHHLFGGDFVVGRAERQIRRINPKFPIRFTGFHYDHQCEPIAARGIRGRGAFTVWSPLQDCSRDDTPRLLLLKIGQRVDDHVPEALKLGSFEKLENQAISGKTIDSLFEPIYAERQCYAPRIPLGSCILFDHRVVHCSYRTADMTITRYSLDFRVVGEYLPDETTRSFAGVIYRNAEFPPPPAPSVLSRAKHAVAGLLR
jgi:hypothetical protein